jgi:soluble lytic murein transglycosylase-like protein
MIDLNGINAMMQRITEIENKIGMHTTAGGGFDRTLQAEIAKSRPDAAAPSGGAGSKTTAAAAVGPTAADGSYGAMIQSASRKYQVDPRLVSAVAEAESHFQQGAVSSAGAVGVMQLMPETAASLGVNPYDAAQNIDGGTHYLRQMLDSFGGDVKKAVAAYNAGAQAVRDYNGVPPYGETESYVNEVLDLYR